MIVVCVVALIVNAAVCGLFIRAWRDRDVRERDERQLLLNRIQAPAEAVTQVAIEQAPESILTHVPMDDDEEFAEAKRKMYGLIGAANG